LKSRFNKKNKIILFLEYAENFKKYIFLKEFCVGEPWSILGVFYLFGMEFSELKIIILYRPGEPAFRLTIA
jgi:hypothetical protein